MYTPMDIRKTMWKRHVNPWSGWSRMLSYPFLFLAIWYHNWIALIIVIVWYIANPFLFPEPESTDNFMSKAVLGEKLWTGKMRSKFPNVLNGFNGIFFVIALYASYTNMLWHVVYPAILSLTFKMWFLDRMVRLYESHNE
jgi:hypothetical protein